MQLRREDIVWWLNNYKIWNKLKGDGTEGFTRRQLLSLREFFALSHNTMKIQLLLRLWDPILSTLIIEGKNRRYLRITQRALKYNLQSWGTQNDTSIFPFIIHFFLENVWFPAHKYELFAWICPWKTTIARVLVWLSSIKINPINDINKLLKKPSTRKKRLGKGEFVKMSLKRIVLGICGI